MNPFELAAHLTDDHFFAHAEIDPLDADEARELHDLEHQTRWDHRHERPA